MRVERAGIALGSNLGDRLGNLREAWRRLCDLAVPGEPLLSTLVYESAPQDCPDGSPPFLNTVVEIGVSGKARELLCQTLAIEESMGRKRGGVANAPRVIDLDLLYVGEQQCADDDLILPHPRIQERRFVLQPLVEMRPDLVLPGEVETVAEQLAALDGGDAGLVAIDGGLED